MSLTRFRTETKLDAIDYQQLLNIDRDHPHIHLVDIPFRETSIGQDQNCQVGVWEKEQQILAWAVFRPIWRTLDYAVTPFQRGQSLEKEVLAWGKEQIKNYSQWIGKDCIGHVELYENTPRLEKIEELLAELGFEKSDWSILRFQIDLKQDFPAYQLPDGYKIRTLNGSTDTQNYIDLVNAVFGPRWMTENWRRRVLQHPAYFPELDLAVESPEHKLVGFCGCWLRQNLGQIEPLGVHPREQGRGLGKALELAAIKTLQEQGAHTLLVEHVSSNEKAVGLSLKTGFRQINNALKYQINTDCL